MKKIIAALLICICFMSNAMAHDHYRGGYYGPRYYHGGYYRHGNRFVEGAIVGAIIGGVMVQPRPVYVQPVYTAPAYQYVRQFDPYCNCWVTVRRVIDPYNPGY